jgi:hypothetical protein
MAINLKIKISVTEVSVLLIHSSDSLQEFIPYTSEHFQSVFDFWLIVQIL